MLSSLQSYFLKYYTPLSKTVFKYIIQYTFIYIHNIVYNMVRYLDNRKIITLSVEEDKYKRFQEIVGSRKASEAIREFIDDVILQNHIESKKDIDERFRLYHKLSKTYDQDMIKLFIKSLDNAHDISRVITNSRVLADLARERRRELFAYLNKEENDKAKIQEFEHQAEVFENMFADLIITEELSNNIK